MFNIEELEKIKKDALERHIPILMDDTLETIEEILKQEKPKKILEVGTAVGYSASQFARVTDSNCKIDTIEIDEEKAKEAQKNIEKIGVADRINIIIGDAVEILPTINNTYDIVFIDAAKGKYPIFLEHAIRMIKSGGLILADNILYKGYVMSDYNKHKQRTAVRHLREYIREITEDEKCKSEILEIGDGLAITRVTK